MASNVPSAIRFVAFRTTQGSAFATTPPSRAVGPTDARSFTWSTEPAVVARVTPIGERRDGTRKASARTNRRTAAGYVSVFTDGASGGLLTRPVSPGRTRTPPPRSGGLASFGVKELKRIGSIPRYARFRAPRRVAGLMRDSCTVTPDIRRNARHFHAVISDVPCDGSHK